MRVFGVDVKLGRTVDKNKDTVEKRIIDSQFAMNTRPSLNMQNLMGDSEIKIPMYPLPMDKLYDIVNYSDCLRTIHQALKKEIFRNGYEVVEKFACICHECKKEFPHVVDKCDECNSMLLREPDPKQKRKAEEFLKDVNENEQDIMAVSETIEDDENTVDDGYMLARKEYYLDINREIFASKLLEIVRVHPKYIKIIVDDTGRPGRDKDGKVLLTCVNHRTKVQRGITHCPECQTRLYIAYFQGEGPEGKKIYYIKDEVMHNSKYKPSFAYGFSPVFAIWMKATTLMNQDYYMLKYYAGQRPPRGLLFVRTPNIASLEKAWNWMLDMFKRNPHMIPPLAIEGEGINGRFTEFIDFMKSLDEMQFTAVREEFRRTCGAVYGVMPIFQADISVSGGLNNEGLQVTVTNRAVEEGQKTYNNEFYPWIMNHLNITDYVLKLLPSEEKDEMSDLQVEAMKIQNARAMQAMGYDVTLNEDNEFEFEPTEVPVEAPTMGMQGNEFGQFGQQPGGESAVPSNPSGGIGTQPAPMGGSRQQAFTGQPPKTAALKKKLTFLSEGTDVSVKKTRVYLKPGQKEPSGRNVQTGPSGGRYYFITKADAPVTSTTEGVNNPAYDRIRNRRRRAIVEFNMKTLREVIKETKVEYDVTKAKDVETLAEFIHDSTFDSKFQGVPKTVSDRIKEYLVRGMTRGYSLKRMMEYIHRTGGKNINMNQAEAIARTEVQALQNKAREWSYHKVDPQEKWRYKWLNPVDHRTTEICKNLVAKTRGGVTLKRLRKLVELESKAAGFEPREWTPHINCRSTFVRVS